MINIGLENFNPEINEVSMESMLLDFIESEQEFQHDQEIMKSIETLEFIKDHVTEYGITDTIKEMIGDQIQYDSVEDLISKIDSSIEGLISKITGNTIDNTKRVCDELVNKILYQARYNISEGKTYKFVDLGNNTPMVGFCKAASDVLGAFGQSYGKRPSSTEEAERVISQMSTMYKSLLSQGADLLRRMEIKEMSASEYKKQMNAMVKAAKEYKQTIAQLDFAKLVSPRSSTADILNKVMKNSSKNDKESKSVYAAMEGKLNNKLNSIVRYTLRVCRIMFTKVLVLIEQNQKRFN